MIAVAPTMAVTVAMAALLAVLAVAAAAAALAARVCRPDVLVGIARAPLSATSVGGVSSIPEPQRARGVHHCTLVSCSGLDDGLDAARHANRARSLPTLACLSSIRLIVALVVLNALLVVDLLLHNIESPPPLAPRLPGRNDIAVLQLWEKRA